MRKKNGPCVAARNALAPFWDAFKRHGAAGRTNGKMTSAEEKGKPKSNPFCGTNIFIVVGNEAVLLSEKGDELLLHEFQRTKGTDLGSVVKKILSAQEISFIPVLNATGFLPLIDELKETGIKKTA